MKTVDIDNEECFLVKVVRWTDTDSCMDGGNFNPFVNYEAMTVGKSVQLNTTVYYPVACVTAENSGNSCKYTFQCRRETNGQWYTVGDDNKLEKIDEPTNGILYLFMSDDSECHLRFY